ncbi:hypothetical protein BN1058_00890 [Paraliobacillus sp. PM-2]|uniref:hypothetical protein n=1 Tax=Paraliobacillus sp. PM-2 TaxID=1462524 RepID=UPI00061C8696|nr:hypothetical protein [Paraliobacillus sp. PM-2]CQR46621.1 hypothetical protein BN1058_00890 [Paraliobacillus sp. PM-2]
MKNFIMPLALIALLLSACSSNAETINFEDKSFANTLYIQKVENNSSSEEMNKMVTDKDKINEVLSMVEGLKVEKINTDTFMEKLQSQSAYMFGFFQGDGKNTEKGKYAFNILEDGTILLNYDRVDNPGTPLITTEKNKDLLNEMKQKLEISF